MRPRQVFSEASAGQELASRRRLLPADVGTRLLPGVPGREGGGLSSDCKVIHSRICAFGHRVVLFPCPLSEWGDPLCIHVCYFLERIKYFSLLCNASQGISRAMLQTFFPSIFCCQGCVGRSENSDQRLSETPPADGEFLN